VLLMCFSMLSLAACECSNISIVIAFSCDIKEGLSDLSYLLLT